MSERTGLIMMKGNPLTLVGNEVKVGDTAPDFEVLDDKLEPVKLSLFKGKVIDISQDTLTLEVTGITEKIEALISILRPYGIQEIARTGRVSISRGMSK